MSRGSGREGLIEIAPFTLPISIRTNRWFTPIYYTNNGMFVLAKICLGRHQRHVNFRAIVFCLGLSFACSLKAGEVMDELNQHFTYRNQPISPKAVQDLMSWVSDRRSGPTAIDLRANDANRYYVEPQKREGWIQFSSTNQDGVQLFGYQHIGRLKNGIHVLHIASNEGGTETFESLLLIRFKMQEVYEGDPTHVKLNQRIVMEGIGEIPLADKAGSKIIIKGNSILIAAKNEKKPVRIDLSGSAE
jgi:hypothetical protein